jgi:hypothetical protein
MGKSKKAPSWRRAFLRALGRTGNVRLAAEAAGVDHSTAYNHRKGDARFAGAWAKVREKVKVKRAPPPRFTRSCSGADCSQQPAARPGDGRPEHSPGNPGEDLIVRVSKKHGAQLVKVGKGRWGPKAEKAFLAELARTACTRRAAAACGFSTTALYKRKEKYPDFAARWDSVEERAKARIFGFLVSSTIATFDPEIEGEELPTVTIAEGIRIYQLKGPASPLGSGPKLKRGSALRYGPPVPGIEEVRANILRKLDAIEAHEARNTSPSL